MSSSERAHRRTSERTFTVGLFGLAGVMLAGEPSYAQSRAESAERTVQADSVQLSITTDKARYTAGEAIQITITVVNATDQAVQLEFTSGQRYDIIIRAADNQVVWRWGLTRGFVQMLGSEILEPGARKIYDYEFTGDLAAGMYTLVGVLTSRNYPLEARASFAVQLDRH